MKRLAHGGLWLCYWLGHYVTLTGVAINAWADKGGRISGVTEEQLERSRRKIWRSIHEEQATAGNGRRRA